MDDEFVLLCYNFIIKKNDIINQEYMFQEFELPINLEKVEKWSNLKNIWFQKINLSLKEFNTFNLNNYKIDNIKIIHNELKHGNIYFVFGYDLGISDDNSQTLRETPHHSIYSFFLSQFFLIFYWLKKIIS
jgi:hypothetical protein